MLEKFLRSPFTMMLIMIMIGVFFVGISEEWALHVYFIPFYAFLIIYFILLFIHNQKHPQRKIKFFTMTPYELREDDEGLQHFTFKAMRKVYIFYYFAVPIGIVLMYWFQYIVPYFAIWLLVAFGVAQQFIYWLEIKKAFSEEV